MSTFEEQINRMKSLMTYGRIDESDKKKDTSILEFKKEGADNRVYGIVKEATKYYIKSCPSGKEGLLESFDYIGGFMNKKDYEYSSYADALKNLELKLASINEAYDSNVNVSTLDPFKREDIVIEGTEKFKNELARQRQIMYNAAMIMNESNGCVVKGGPACNCAQPEAETGKRGDEECCEKEVKADMEFDGEKTELDKKATPFNENPTKINESEETDFAAGVPTEAGMGEADTEKNNTPFTETVNEEEEISDELLVDAEDGEDEFIEDKIDFEDFGEDEYTEDEFDFGGESVEDEFMEDEFNEDFGEDEYVEDGFGEDEFADEDFDFEEEIDECGNQPLMEAKKNAMNSIVESVVKDILAENELHDFGKHPGYRKRPMTTPVTGKDETEHGRDWNDKSAHSEEPFGTKIGDGFPFNKLVDAVTREVLNTISEGLKKK